MFTGIVEEVGTIKLAGHGGLTISAVRALEGMKEGDSINVNGACLTITTLDGGVFSVDVMPETLRRTNLGRLSRGGTVNLERPLTLEGRLGGHLVQGHVDGVGRVLSTVPEEGAKLVQFWTPPDLMRYIVEKGFIAVDGVSLTVVERRSTSFSVSLVAYTRDNTTLGGLRPGALVNLEIDIVAKYVEQLGGERKSGITPDFLVEHGFLAR